MSKLRIYELAKELGVDNKAIIAKAAELGMHGKASHSSSLDAGEADQIRRAIIRQSITVKDTETVKVRVDKSTGTTEAFVERRKGNVIRRRRQDSAETAATAQGAEEHLLEAQPEAAGPETQPQTETPALQPAEETVSVESAQPEAAPPVEQAEEEAAGLPGEALPEERESAQPAAPAKEAAAGVQARERRAAEEPPVREEKPVAPETPLSEAAPEKKATPGPRVLGRIELPQKKAPAASAARTEARRAGPYALPQAPVVEDEDEDEVKSRKKVQKKKGLKREISRIDLLDYEGGEMRRAGRGGKTRRSKEIEEEKKAAPEIKTRAGKRVVKMGETITVGEMAKQMSVKAGEVIAKLIQLGVLATINQAIDKDIATIVAEEFEFLIESTTFDEATVLEERAADDPLLAKPRPPVVTVMGHVDHGKTSLLDSIRKSSVAAREHGGITQHIGAYNVLMEDGRSVTFIDTPGHAAFTAMRARGAKVTDIVVLVVAADDGVMPQTIEAINHAKAAQVPIVVAVNKVDKHEANPDRIRQQLVEHGIQAEEWGGDTMFFNVSALKSTGIKELLEGLLLQAEVRELKANPDRRARGAVVEVKQDRGRGTVATVLVQSGTLRVGDVFVAGSVVGRVRSMDNSIGERVPDAGPSIPVEITGLNGVPLAGDDFFVVESEAQAKEVTGQRLEKRLERERVSAAGSFSWDEFAKRANEMGTAELNVILKADVQGSVEAVREAVEKLSTPKVKVTVVHAAVGGVTESDVQLAIASKAVIFGFNVRSEVRAAAEAEASGIEMRFYRIIYELLDDIKTAMAGKLAPIRQEVSLGRVEVRDTFSVPKVGTVAGCYVLDGTVKRGAFVRLLRDSRVIYEGRMGSLKRFKDDVREVQSGYECGIGLDNYNDVKTGDTMEVYEYKEVAATID